MLLALAISHSQGPLACPAGLADPAQGAQRRHEQVFAAPQAIEGGDAVQSAPHRRLRQREAAGRFVQADDGIALGTKVDEVAAVDPLLLQELDRVIGARADEDEEEPAGVLAVIRGCDIGCPFGAEGRGASNDAVDVHVGQDRQPAVARIQAPHVGRMRAYEAAWVLRKIEIVVACRVGAQFRIVALGRQNQGRAAAPAADHLGREQVLSLLALGMFAQEVVEGADAAVVLAQDDIGSVAPQFRRLRHAERLARLAVLAQDELARGDGRAVARQRVHAAARDVGLGDSITEAEGILGILVRAELNDAAWSVIRETPGVTSFVGNEGNATPVKTRDVAKFLMPNEAPSTKGDAAPNEAEGEQVVAMPEKEVAKKYAHDFEVGEAVTILSGPLAAVSATISEIDPETGKMQGLVSIFGRETPVELSPTEIERIS
mgnify:CR=1 FL=1